MSRRVRTLLVSGVLFLVLFVLALTLPVPYVVLSPGPTFNTLATDDRGSSIIVIKGATQHTVSGHLNMTTVNVSTQPLTVFTALSGWLQHDEVVVPKSSVYPPGTSQQQVDQQNTADFAESQDNAIAAAACELGYPAQFGVIVVQADTPAKGKLQPADVLKTIDGKPVASADALTAVLQKTKPGTTITIGIVRAGKPQSVTLAVAAPLSGKTGARIGVQVGQVCATPYTVDLGLGNEIGGPSAGLMFALGIMDKVGTTNLTAGRFIAGTGTIDSSGTVGPIGGIQLKMIAARHAGATVFLAPAGNCSDVRGAVPKGLQVVKVDTLHNAVQDLLAIEAGKSTPSC
ncbi:MAG: Lon-like protease [Pseudonocardiales bacterium]|nr:Lon-like protease [Pseudonocardiales bacterium]